RPELSDVVIVDVADGLGDRLHQQVVRVLQDGADGRLAGGLSGFGNDAPVGVQRVETGPRPRGLGDPAHAYVQSGRLRAYRSSYVNRPASSSQSAILGRISPRGEGHALPA